MGNPPNLKQRLGIPAHPHPGLIWGGVSLLMLVVILNAWVSDDAYITFRTVFNFTQGHGPVYNVGERVQTFTNPLWMFLMSFFYLFTGEAYFTTLGLSFAMLLGGCWILVKRVLDMGWGALAMLMVMTLSLSFVEYSTSGLENVLNFFLLSAFVAVWRNQGMSSKGLFWMSLLAGLGTFSRMDTLLLYAPALAWCFWQQRSWRNAMLVLIGFSPFIIWEFFSLIYYGFPFPNTAYAKLNAGLSQAQMFQQGLYYYAYTLRKDPLSLATMLAGGLTLFCLPKGKWAPILLGMALYMAYIVRIGGDFMGGRFMFLPFAIAVMAVGMAFNQGGWYRWVLPFLLLCGLLNPGAPQYHWAKNIERKEPWLHGVADERSFYYNASSLVDLEHDDFVLEAERMLDSVVANPPKQNVLVWDWIGYTGYSVGPQLRVVDRFALADPLLSRLPMAQDPDWRIGHFARVLPYGYVRTLRSGKLQIEDPGLREYYQKLCIVTQGDIWSWERLRTIFAFNTGQLEHLIDKARYKDPSPVSIDFNTLLTSIPQTAAWDSPNTTVLFAKRPLFVKMPGRVHHPAFRAQMTTRTNFTMTYRLSGKELEVVKLKTAWAEPDRLVWTDLKVPETALTQGYDEICIEAGGGNDHYSIGQMLVVGE